MGRGRELFSGRTHSDLFRFQSRRNGSLVIAVGFFGGGGLLIVQLDKDNVLVIHTHTYQTFKEFPFWTNWTFGPCVRIPFPFSKEAFNGLFFMGGWMNFSVSYSDCKCSQGVFTGKAIAQWQTWQAEGQRINPQHLQLKVGRWWCDRPDETLKCHCRPV